MGSLLWVVRLLNQLGLPLWVQHGLRMQTTGYGIHINSHARPICFLDVKLSTKSLITSAPVLSVK